MAKVMLTLCNSPMDNLIPLGPSLLSACLKRAGHEVRLFDTTFYQTREHTGDEARVETLQVKPTNLADFGIKPKPGRIEEDFRNMVDRYAPDLIGLSAVETTFPIARGLLKVIADIKIPKIVGGVHATLAREEVIQNPDLDMICIGEGEGAIVDLADRIGQGKDYSDVLNLWVKKGRRIIRNAPRALVDLDSLPVQDWTIYEKERFFKPMGGKVWVMGNIEAARSCMNKCGYCANEALHEIYKGIGRYYREKSPEKVIAELRQLKKEFGLQYVYFIAENFLATSRERFEKFAELYKAQDVKTPFYIDTRPETLSPEKVKVLGAIGCEGIAMGIESGDDDFRKKVLGRNMRNSQIVQAAKNVRENSNIRLSVNNIIGFPTETREQIFRTIEVNRKVPAHSFMVNLFNPYHGTRLRELAIKMGYIKPDEEAGDYRTDYALDMPQLSAEELKGLRRTFPLYVRFPKSRWKEIRRAEKFDDDGNKAFRSLSQEYREKFM